MDKLNPNQIRNLHAEQTMSKGSCPVKIRITTSQGTFVGIVHVKAVTTVSSK